MAFTVVGGGLSTYVPTTNDLATGALQVEFTRSINSFALTRYAQLVPTTKMTGFYLRQDVADNVRLTSDKEFAWPLGNDRPTGKQNSFDFIQYSTQRYAFPFYIPQETTQQAAWDVVAQHARSKAQLAMTARTNRAASVLTDSTVWGSNYAAFLNSSPLSLGSTADWSGSTVDNAYIQKTIQKVMRLVSLSSGGAVAPNQLMMVISPDVANVISQAPEVQAYVKNYPQALSFLQGSDTFSRWGIPSTLFGLGDVIVDDSVKVTTKKGAATQTSAFVYGNGAYFVSRPGGLVGVEGASSFSTVQIFAYEDMTVEQFNDPMNRRIEGRVIDNSVAAVVAPVGGFAIGDVVNAS
jgi:hypothetical protein